MKIKHSPKLFKLPLLKNYEAIVIYPYLFYKTKPLDSVTLNHERIHFSQIKKYGVFGFYRKYLWEYLSNRVKGMSHWEAYAMISYEREAYENQHNMDYKVT